MSSIKPIALHTTAGTAMATLIQPRPRVRCTIEMASINTTTPKAPNNTRAARVCSMNGYSSNPASCTSSSAADG